LITLHITDRDGALAARDAEPGQSLMRALRRLGYDIQAICGGAASCATCHVHVAPEWVARLAPRESDEVDLLSDTESFDPATSRLSCQIPLTSELDGLILTIAPED
jgi:2Fe-2S ferredoxin